MDTGKAKAGSIGLTYPVLAKSNYTSWALKMKVFMQAQGVWTAMEPSDAKAPLDDKIDKVALAMIYQGIPEDMLLSIADKKTAKEGWEAIRLMCQGADRVKRAKIQTLKAEFESLRMDDSEQLEDFYMKLNGLVSTIRALGEEMGEAYVVKKLLHAVPSRFLQIASTIEQFGDLEKEEWIKREKGEDKLLLIREDWLKRSNKESADGQSSFRGRSGRAYQNRGDGAGRDRSTVRCFNCNVTGHYAAECKRPRRERNHKSEANLVQIKDDEPALLLSELDEKKTRMVLLNEENVKPKLEPTEKERKFSQL
ncbi:uncharacterized protein LOC141680565 [Apium graveolens]|uniref:uncharacterized protein LOC141680565 n=1 Tax=Apium graveolens TaxID=4045 RepID=UPI003D7BAC5C